MYVSIGNCVQLGLIAVLLLCGCERRNHSSVPVSVARKTPYSYHGRIGRIWGGDNFEIVCDGKIHYGFIRGIDCPEPGQPFFKESVEKFAKLCRKRRADIKVFARDDMKREVCDLVITDPTTYVQTDPALELVKSGLAWHDLNEEEWAQKYKNAEATARKEKIGIWSQANPIPPWEYWERQVNEFENAMPE